MKNRVRMGGIRDTAGGRTNEDSIARRLCSRCADIEVVNMLLRY